MRKWLAAPVLFASLILLGAAAPATERPGGDLQGVVGGQVSFGSSPDRNPHGQAEIVGFDERGGTYVEGTSGTLDATSALFRFEEDGSTDRTFSRRVRAHFGRRASAAVVGDRILVANGTRVLAFTPTGAVDRNFAANGYLTLGHFTHQIFANDDHSFYLVKTTHRFGLGIARLERYTASGRRIASIEVDAGQWFEIRDVSPTGEVAFTTGWDPGDYGSVEGLYVVDPTTDKKPRYVKSVEYTGFNTVTFLPGGGLLVDTDYGYLTAINRKGEKLENFGEDGILTCPSPDEYESGSPDTIGLDPDGRIIVAGSGDEGECGISRHLADGSLDAGFDHVAASAALTGKTTDLAASRRRIVIAHWDPQNGGPALTGIKSNGEIDTDFGHQGRTHEVLRTPDRSVPTDSTADARGRILVAGLNRSADNRSSWLALTRFRPDGRPDRFFGQQSRLKIDLGGKVTAATLTRLSSGGVMVSGTVESGGDKSGFLLRLREDGRVDKGFGERGLMRIQVPGFSSVSFFGSVRFGNGLMVAGAVCCSDSGQDALIAAFDRDGQALASFGDGGFVVRDLLDVPSDPGRAGDFDRALDLDLDRTGQPVVVAETNPRSSYPKVVTFGLAADGTASSLFGGRTIRVPAFRTLEDGRGGRLRLNLNLRASGIEVLPSGHLLYAMAREDRRYMGGGTRAKTLGHLTLLDRRGELDRKFGRRGQVTNRDLSFRDLALDRCGRILVAGSTAKRTIFSFGLARFAPDGRPAGKSPAGGFRFGGPNSLERGVSLSLTGSHAYVAGQVAPGYRSTKLGLVGFRARACR